MGIVIVGIDEAGYGPRLGPLAVGMSAWRVRNWTPSPESPVKAPNLWSLLRGAVCKAPSRSSDRIAIADSKALKLPNQWESVPELNASDGAAPTALRSSLAEGASVVEAKPARHPLLHLERGVLAGVRAMHGELPGDDDALLTRLGACWPAHDWYCCPPTPMPLACDAAQLRLAGNMLAAAMSRAGVELVGLSCVLVGEEQFNRIARAAGSKGDCVLAGVGVHLRAALAQWGGTAGSGLGGDSGDALWVVCDRLGGRASYAGVLRSSLEESADPSIDVVEESDRRSRYMLRTRNATAGVSFITEGEQSHLPIAMASMVAKLTRELAMARFNRFWCDRARRAGLTLRATAGYAQDGGRWLRDADCILTRQERECLVRLV
ncbi:MAG: hypothetical protein SFZ23_02495 [Planctomycetota bacterium]|nr:hypothetical protein [Planctomycetota bacterium]